MGFRRTIWLVLIICGLLVASCGPYLFAQDKIIAIVNNEIITQSDLDDFFYFMRMQFSQNLKGQELEEKLQSMKLDLIDKLIEDRLILQEAKKNDSMVEVGPKKFFSLKPDESKVKARLEEIRSRYGSEEAFQRSLAGSGLTQADLEKKIREQMLMYNIVEFKVKEKISVKPTEITAFYEDNIAEFMLTEEREFEGVRVIDEDTAKFVEEGLAKGRSLQELAAKFSLVLNTLAAKKDGRLRKDIEECVFALEAGKISGPIRLADGFYFFSLKNIIPARQQLLSEVRDKIYLYLFNKKMEEGLSSWLDELKAQAYIKVIKD